MKILLLLSFVLVAGCGRRVPSNVKDFSRSNLVSMVLGEPEREFGDGLQHWYLEADGRTSPTNMAGVPCRLLHREKASVGFLYFSVAPTFKNRDVRNVRIEAECLVPKPVSVSLQFDASSRGPGDSVYRSAGPPVVLTDTETWQTIRFVAQGATFKNSQNGGSDFRLCISPPDIYVRRVTLTRLSGDLPGQTDFSKSNVVSLALGDPETELGQGITHAGQQPDGLTVATNVGGVACRRLQIKSDGYGYLYFRLDPAFKKGAIKNVTIQLEYLSAKSGVMGLEYDTTGAFSGRAYVGAGVDVKLANATNWQTAVFPVRGASFRNAQNGGADFRFCVKPPDIYIRRVTITREGK